MMKQLLFAIALLATMATFASEKSELHLRVYKAVKVGQFPGVCKFVENSLSLDHGTSTATFRFVVNDGTENKGNNRLKKVNISEDLTVINEDKSALVVYDDRDVRGKGEVITISLSSTDEILDYKSILYYDFDEDGIYNEYPHIVCVK